MIESMTIYFPNLGIFYVDQYMKVEYIPPSGDIPNWTTHGSKLNIGSYPELHREFASYLHENKYSGEIPDYKTFVVIMEKLFDAYCLMR
jgi:hypothetical protein